MRILFNRLDSNLQKKLQHVSLIALDFDGVLTNNKVVHSQNHNESVVRSRADSLAIDLLDRAGLYSKDNYKRLDHLLDIVILSSETNPIVESVSEKIRIKCQRAVYKKLEVLKEEVKSRKIDFKNVLFIGNDINDIECIEAAEIGVAVADSFPQVTKVADYITSRRGGEGAFREVCELIMYAKKVHPFP
jgi:N-acylneuraminate cytidylyltransferase